MPLAWLDHVNIRTSDLAGLRHFYTEILGLRAGPRPPFEFDGAWIYCGERACIHLVEVPRTPAATDIRVEHFAFMAAGLADFMTRLRDHRVPWSAVVIGGDDSTPNAGNVQINIHDPDGNHIEVQFRRAEAASVDLGEFGSPAAA